MDQLQSAKHQMLVAVPVPVFAVESRRPINRVTLADARTCTGLAASDHHDTAP